MDTKPTPTPPMMRKATSCAKLVLSAHPIAQMQKNTAAISIVFFLPMASLVIPAKLAPAMEPMRAQPTYHPCCMVSSENCCVTIPIVPDITAVS